MTPGRIIVIEGGDAVGKKTQSELLFGRLAESAAQQFKPQPMLYSFPRYKTPLGQAILRHLKKEIAVAQLPGENWGNCTRAPEDAMVFQCMMTIDKYHAASEFEPPWFEGSDLVIDRYWQSAFVFGSVDGLDPDWLLQIHQNLPMADLNILLDLPVETAVKRRPEARDRYEENTDHRNRVRAAYRQLWEMDAHNGSIKGSGRWVVLDASRSVEKVHEVIWQLVQETTSMHDEVEHTEPTEGGLS